MKNKFIRIISPASFGAALLLDIASIGLCVAATQQKKTSLPLCVIGVLALLLGALTTAETLRHGIRLKENEMEFTALDKDNVYAYEDIEKTEIYKDTKASFKKNFTQRYSNLILYLTDGTVATAELGFTTKRKLRKIEEEIKKRIGG